MTSEQIYITITLLDGKYCSLLIPNGAMYSRINRKWTADSEFDVIPFMMQEICRIDGKQESLEFYLNLNGDDYTKITEALQSIVKRIE